MADTDEEDASSVLGTENVSVIRPQRGDTMSTFESNSDSSVHDSRCDIRSNNTGDNDENVTDCIEDRFRVDRRKLERLLQGKGEELFGI